MNVSVNIELKPLNIEPLAIAKYFYERGITSHLFIQKLLYFTFLKGLKNGLLLFEEKFQAWRYGAVLESVHRVMSNKDGNIEFRLRRLGSEDLFKLVVGDYLTVEKDKVHYEKIYEPRTPQQKILHEVLTKLENALQGCAEEIDLPYLGESLLTKCRELDL
ncbi:7718_t:CDS:2 [Racocetra persica]|uniref:7718_t:CDS:1 n=1 Tax=Racocetra persica TaxID=160502 RepID=A0ACA9R3F1_9GLOM|nr:7718_t:CDS:2 [Racocetra persica]